MARYQVSFEKASKEKMNLKLKEIQDTWPPSNRCPRLSAFSALSASGVLCIWRSLHPQQFWTSATPRLAESESRRLPDSSSRQVVFQLQISPQIRSQNRNGSKCSVRDQCQTDLCKNLGNRPHCHIPLNPLFMQYISANTRGPLKQSFLIFSHLFLFGTYPYCKKVNIVAVLK